MTVSTSTRVSVGVLLAVVAGGAGGGAGPGAVRAAPVVAGGSGSAVHHATPHPAASAAGDSSTSVHSGASHTGRCSRRCRPMRGRSGQVCTYGFQNRTESTSMTASRIPEPWKLSSCRVSAPRGMSWMRDRLAFWPPDSE